jgi:hypothetical protein
MKAKDINQFLSGVLEGKGHEFPVKVKLHVLNMM